MQMCSLAIYSKHIEEANKTEVSCLGDNLCKMFLIEAGLRTPWFTKVNRKESH